MFQPLKKYQKGGAKKLTPGDIQPSAGDLPFVLNPSQKDEVIAAQQQAQQMAKRQYLQADRSPVNYERRNQLNKQTAEAQGLTTDSQGRVSTLFNANSKGYNLLHNAGDLVGNVAETAMAVDGVEELGNLAGKAIKKSVQEGTLSNTYKLNPWAKGNVLNKWNPDNYYRAGNGQEFLDDIVNTGKVRAVSAPVENTGTFNLGKSYSDKDTYWAKGSPLDGKNGKQFYGDHIVEASNEVPFIKSVNQRLKEKGFWENPFADYNSNHTMGQYVRPRESYFSQVDEAGNAIQGTGKALDYNPEQMKLYKPDWLKGYKEVDVPNTQQFKKVGAISSGEDKLRMAFDEMYAKPSKLKGAFDTKEELLNRLGTEEGNKRAVELGRPDVARKIEKLKLNEDVSDYAYYRQGFIKPAIGLNPSLPESAVRNITRHELEHAIQSGSTTPIDDVLSQLELRQSPKPLPVERPDRGRVDGSDVNSLLKPRQNATDYFANGSDGREKSAFLAELQQHLVDNNYIKHPYDNITPEILKDAYMDNVGSEGYPLRIFNIMKPTDNNYNVLSQGLNKMLTPTAIAVGAAAMNKKQQGGFSTLGYKKNSRDKNNPYNLINSNRITMQDVPHPVLGISDTGDQRLMMPGEEHQFSGNQVMEIPIRQSGGFQPLQQSRKPQDLSYLPDFGNSIMEAIATRVNNNRDNAYQQNNLTNPLNYIPQINNTNPYETLGVQQFQQGGDTGDSMEDEDFLYGSDDQPAQQEAPQEEAPQAAAPAEEATEEPTIALDTSTPDMGDDPNPANPDTGEGVYASPGMIGENGSEEEAYDYLTAQKGLPPHIAAGIVGNLMAESNLNTGAVGDNGQAKGIAQWHPDRIAGLQSFAQTQGKNPGDLHTQLDYVVQEASQRGDLNKMANTRTPAEAAYMFAKHYERPAKIDNKRMTNAERIYGSFTKR